MSGICNEHFTKCFSCCSECLRSIPTASIFAFMLSIAGYMVVFQGRDPVAVAVAELGYVLISHILNHLVKVFSVACVVNFLCVLAAFPASGKTREICFAHPDSWNTWLLQIIIGRGVLGVIMALCILLVMVEGAVVCVFAAAGPLLFIVVVVCDQSTLIQTGFVTILSFATGVNVTQANLNAYCEEKDTVTAALIRLVIGGGVLVFAQVLLLASVSSNYQKISLQPHLADSRKKLTDAEKGKAGDYGSTQDAIATGYGSPPSSPKEASTRYWEK